MVHAAGATPSQVARFVTDENGRTATMLGDGALAACTYELRLQTAAYLADHGAATLDAASSQAWWCASR